MIENPVWRGFHPDGSVCRVGGTFYIAASTFESWPGICIYRPQDLTGWEPASRPVCIKKSVSKPMHKDFDTDFICF